MLPTIAEKLGYSTATNGTMWRDAALVALNEVRGAHHMSHRLFRCTCQFQTQSARREVPGKDSHCCVVPLQAVTHSFQLAGD